MASASSGPAAAGFSSLDAGVPAGTAGEPGGPRAAGREGWGGSRGDAWEGGPGAEVSEWLSLTDWTTGEPRRSSGERMGATRKEKPTETPALGLSGDVVEGFEEEGWRMVEGAQPGSGGLGRRASGAGSSPGS